MVFYHFVNKLPFRTMAIGSCRGREKKQALINQYELKPIAHLTLLNNQEKQGCCGKVTNRYYAFKARNRSTDEVESFYVGYDCAEQLLDLIGHEKLRLFNPLQSLQSKSVNISDIRRENILSDARIDPLNMELSNAINLLCTTWEQPPRLTLLSYLDYIRQRPSDRTQNFAIIKFNNILGKDRVGRTLSQMIEELRKDNPTMKHFSFPLMLEILQKSNENINL